jgi:N-acetylmuramoyl-L-alanine amidase
VVDITGMVLTRSFTDQFKALSSSDPYIARIRAGQRQPDVVRLVLELKTTVVPQVFQLEPVGPYRRRLVLDLYPEHGDDPLLTLLQSTPEPTKLSGDGTDRPPAKGPASGKKHRTDRVTTIAIDAGHGGEDPGAVGYRGTHEKDVTLAIARQLATLIQNETDYRVLLTRDSDYFVPLGTRVAKAREVEADLFVSLHADAWVNTNAHGASVFALSESGASSKAAADLARQQNDADRIGGLNVANASPYLTKVLSDLSYGAQISDSLRFGDAVLHELGQINPLHKGAVEQAAFAVLKAPDIPSVLVETAFISNPDEELRLRDGNYQHRTASAVLSGIQAYLSRHPGMARNALG